MQISIRNKLQDFADSKQDVDEKAFILSWLGIYDIVHQLQDKYMRTRSQKATRILDVVVNFLFKIGTWVDYRLPEYTDVPWFRYVQLTMLTQSMIRHPILLAITTKGNFICSRVGYLKHIT